MAPRRRQMGFSPARGGFTLVELIIVATIIALMMAIAMPRLMPAITYSEFEGEARYLAAYGRAAVAYCALANDSISLKIDLDTQEYWAMTEPDPTEAFFLTEEQKEREDAEPEDYAALNAMLTGEDYEEDEATEESDRLRAEFDRFAMRVMRARASNVKQAKGFLDEIGPLFEDEFDLDEIQLSEPREVSDPLLQRGRLPRNVVIERVWVGDTKQESGLVEIDVGPLGLSRQVVFYLRQVEKDEYYTILWDALTGDTRMYEGEVTEF